MFLMYLANVIYCPFYNIIIIIIIIFVLLLYYTCIILCINSIIISLYFINLVILYLIDSKKHTIFAKFI